MTSQNLKRHCQKCLYPQINCLCKAIKTQSCPHQLIIIQHPHESKNAKNSARLVKLAITNCQIIQGEAPQDFAQLQQDLATIDSQNILLVYPSESAIEIKDYQQQPSNHPLTLIFIDGSWRKAHKILALNPWLQHFQTVKFNQPPKSRYKIRKAPRTDSLSTIEAVAYTLEQLDQTDTTPLLQLFDAMIDKYMSHIPKALHHRYQN